MAHIAEYDVPMLRSSSSSGIESIVPSAARVRRVALAKARRVTARRELDLAKAEQSSAESELEEARAASVAGTIGRLADVASEGGNSARVRPRSSAERAVHYYSWKECNKVLHACLLKKRRRAQAYLRKREATSSGRASCSHGTSSTKEV